jgi:hypothetical protein
VQQDYHHIEQNRSIYSAKKRLIAEIDLIGHHPHGIDVFEVKCGYRITKARRQLYKIKKLLLKTYKKAVNLYFYHGGAGQLIRIY